jgi:hypothetical protein
MTATDELRRLLDERGVKHEGSERSLRWRDRYGIMMQAFPLANGELGMEVWSCTPAQAIAATLGDTDATGARQGDGTCHDMGGCRWFRCSACGFGIEDMYVNDEDEYPPEEQPRYCPNCGRLVVEVGEWAT